MLVFLLLVGLIGPSWGLKARYLVKTSIHEELKPPPEFMQVRNDNIKLNWTDMPLDHFDPQNNVTFRMRFAYNEQFFGGDGSPIFIMVGGYALASGWIGTGNMYLMAEENKGYMLTTEYRYYGETRPFDDFSTPNLRFLSMDQALADLAYFIGELKEQPRFANSKVILYGGSKAANMVTWFKKRYPHLALGVVASSGPYLAKIDFAGYLEVVHEAFTLEGGEKCIDILRQGIQDTVDAMKTESGRRTVEQAYGLCAGTFNFTDRYDLGYFAGMTTWSFSNRVQTSNPGNLMTICDNFKNGVYGATPLEQLGKFVRISQGLPDDNCWILKYDMFLASYLGRSDARSWYYQTCTEFGYFQVAPRSGTVFDALSWLDLDFYLGVCKQFDPRFDEAFALAAAERSNLVYGGLTPEVKNTINIHGYIDPWRALGIYENDVHETSPTYTVPRASHCFDFSSWRPTDTIRMTAVQQAARRIVASWLND